MGAIAAAILAMAMSSGASDGLVRMAVFGGGSGFANERSAEVSSRGLRGGSPGSASSRAGSSFSPNVIDTLFTDCNSGAQEYMAPGGVELSDGSKWAMVHPTCHPDHFIIEYADGTAERWDVGCNENTKIPFMVASTESATRNFPPEAAWGTATSIAPGCNVAANNPPPPPDCTDSSRYPSGSVLNTARDACICPPNTKLYEEEDGSSVCAAILRYETGEYTAANCTGAGWETGYEIDDNDRVRELCNIPYQIAVTLQAPLAFAAAAAPLQTPSSGDEKDACILTEHSAFGGDNTLAKCEHENLFGAHSLPQKPENFAAGARLMIADATGAAARQITHNGAIVQRVSAPQQNNGNNSGGGSSGGGGGAGLAVGGIAIAGVLIYAFTGGAPGDISMLPQYSFQHSGGNAYYSYGARWEYEKENWRAHWSAAQTGGNSDWRYGSGVEWSDEIWTASFGGESFGETADMDFSFAARKNLRGWTVKSGVNSAVRLDEYGADSSHRLFAEAALRRNRWTLALHAALNQNKNQTARAKLKLKRDF